jgi:hypothetical protein
MKTKKLNPIGRRNQQSSVFFETSLETLRVFYTYLYNKVYAEWEKENKIVKELGGLFVLGTS